MTADRRIERRSNRNQLASPYSQRTRPAKQPPPAKKSSSWSFSGLLSFLNPLRSKTSESSDDVDVESVDEPEIQPGPSRPTQIIPLTPTPARLSSNVANLNSQPTSPATTLSPLTFNNNASPSKNVDAVKNYLSENGSRQLNPVEIAGLVSLLQDSMDGADDDPEPFRFSRSPSRSNSPLSPIFSLPTNTTTLPTESTSKSLSKNPNGNYKWQGAGSARPRNRFHSPAFGTSRSAPSKMKITPSEPPKTDTKRRRVGVDAETSSPQRASVAKQNEPSQPTAGPSKLPNGQVNGNGQANDHAQTNGNGQGNGENGKANGPPATPRVLKHTTPAVPSPLRQAWVQTDSPSPSPPQPSSKQTRAASFMTELIREATPTKKPDLSNPYQTASPVKTGKAPTKKVPPKRTRAASKQPVEEEEEKMELSTQAIIEATVPKGSKRSRPPKMPESNSVEFPTTSSSPPPQQSPLTNGFPKLNGRPKSTVEEDEEDSGPRVKKRQRTVEIEVEVEDVDMSNDSALKETDSFVKPSEVVEPVDDAPAQTNGIQTSASSSGSSPVSPLSSSRSFLLGSKSSVPKEPSKLRFSIQAENSDKEESSNDGGKKRDPIVDVKALALRELPTSVFNIVATATIGHKRAADEARTLALSSLQPHEWSREPQPSKASSTPPATTGGFDWAAAGMKLPSAASATWTCSTCMLTNSGAGEQCSVCEAPRPGAATTAAPQKATLAPVASSSSAGFDWAAAGMKAPTADSSGSWTCSTCMLTNKGGNECSVCESPRA